MRIGAVSAIALLLIARLAQPQGTSPRVAPVEVVIGSDEENYLRYLQAKGLVAEYPWSLRGFALPEMRRLSASPDSQPWSGRMTVLANNAVALKLLPLQAAVRVNTGFPYGSNDGPIWAGRGFTGSVDGGVAFSLGPLSAVLHPIAFVAQNSSFALMANGQSGNQAYANGQFPEFVDLPQRFGASSYSRLDLGESTIRVDLFDVGAGVSTANIGWGPMEQYELILGGNGPGFPHAFVGTTHPVNVGIGHIHSQVFWGSLDQSKFSPVVGAEKYTSWLEPGTKRFATGLAALFQPRGIPGLEVGATRFFHLVWPRSGLPHSYFTAPFGSVFKRAVPVSIGFPDPQSGNANQLASLFGRWVFNKSGFEIYGEYGHEDHNYDLRDLVQEPDHSRMYALGLRKTVRADSTRVSGLRMEIVNYQLPTLGRNRSEGSIYIHGLIRQGHTVRGQPLGADVGAGTGAGSFIAWDTFTRGGKSTISLTRTVRQEDGTFFINGVDNPNLSDVLYGLGFEQTRFFSRVDVRSGGTIVRELNRDFTGDVWNLNLLFAVSYRGSR